MTYSRYDNLINIFTYTDSLLAFRIYLTGLSMKGLARGGNPLFKDPQIHVFHILIIKCLK